MKKTSPSCLNLNNRLHIGVGLGMLVVLVVVLLAFNLCMGSVQIPLQEVVSSLFTQNADSVNGTIVAQIRFPRALAAAMLGGALALAGYLLQTFFQNPIAGPFVLGISSGAKLFVALTLVLIMRAGMQTNSLWLIASAFLGALLSMGFVLVFGQKVYQSSMLIVSGVMIGYICSAITDFVVTFADDSDIVNLHNWSLGSFSGITWANVRVFSVIVLFAFVCVFLLSKPIAACQMGESYARSMGVSIKWLRIGLIFFSSLLAATVTAYAGPISFVGIAVPQLSRAFFKTAKPLVMVPACFLGGAVFCLLSDLIARNAFSPMELSVSSVTALFGAPIVLWVMLRKKGGRV